MRRTEVLLLGSVEVVGDDGRAVDVGPPKRRAVLAALALEVNRVVPAERLTGLVWGPDPPVHARTALQGHISALRKVFGTVAGIQLCRRDPGYLLAADAEAVDVHRFFSMVATARSSPEGEDAIELLGRALALWRGPALLDVAGGPLRTSTTSWLTEARTAAVEDWSERALRLGRGGEVLEVLTEQVDAQPMRESSVRLLVLALAAAGRQAEAIERFHHTRRLLAEELGVDPGPALRDAYQVVLRSAEQPPTRRPPTAPVPGMDAFVPSQLPRETGGFAGRRTELSALERLAVPGAVCLLTGAGGVGKTALALRHAHAVAGEFRDGQLFADLRGFDETEPADPAGVLASFLRFLAVDERDIPSSADERGALYRTLLAGRRVLVVLDNARSTEQVRPLLPGAPGCLTLVTSRARLDGLVVRDGTALVQVDVLPADEAYEVLAATAGPHRVTAEPAAARDVIEMCDRLPLALRIAGARLVARPRMPVAELAAELRDEQRRLDVLAVEDGAVAVGTVLALTGRTLPANTRAVLPLLGVHPGMHVDRYVVAVLSNTPPDAARAVLERLAAAHLVQEAEPGRYTRHDLVRLYTRRAAENDLTAQDYEHAVDRLLGYYVHTADLAGQALEPQADSFAPYVRHPPRWAPAVDSYRAAAAWLDAERENLRAVTELAHRTGRYALAWRLADRQWAVYYLRGHRDDWRRVLALGLESARLAADTEGQVGMLRHLGIASFEIGQLSGRLAEASGYFEQALHLARDAGLTDAEARLLNSFGVLHSEAGRPDEAVASFEQGLHAARRAGRPYLQTFLLSNLSKHHRDRGAPAAALACARQALTILDGLPADRMQVDALRRVASACMDMGHVDEARQAAARAVAVAREMGVRREEAFALVVLGEIDQAAGADAAARAAWTEAVDLFTQLGLPSADDVRARLAAGAGWRARRRVDAARRPQGCRAPGAVAAVTSERRR